MSDRVSCCHCEASVADVEAAIEAGWVPGYWDDATDEDVCEPVCPVCVERLGIVLGEDDVWCRPVAEVAA